MSDKGLKAQSMAQFFKERVPQNLRGEVLIPRFTDDEGQQMPFVIRGISEEENEALRESCKRPQPNGEIKMDTNFYYARLLVACTIYPDFKSAELQENYGVLGAEAAAKKMLLAGEYHQLLSAIKDLCGFKQNINEVKEQIKKE